jgi:Ca2+-binding RTX toxin-like protein
MATITGTAGADVIRPGFPGNSPGVTGGQPGPGDDLIIGTGGADTLDGGGGFDTLDFAQGGPGVLPGWAFTVNFGTGRVGKPGATDLFANIERVVTGAGDDVFALAPAAALQGSVLRRLFADAGTGTNTINGLGAQVNIADFASLLSPVSVDLLGGLATAADTSTTLIAVLSARGTAFGDVLLGNAFANTFLPGSGANAVDGGEGFDSVDYRDLARAPTDTGITFFADATAGSGTVFHGDDGSGSPWVDTLTGVEQVTGTWGADVFVSSTWFAAYNPLGGDDVVDGGVDSNAFVTYHQAGLTYTRGARIDLFGFAALDPWGGNDSLQNVQSAGGTPLDDVLIGAGNGRYSFLVGYGGRDQFFTPAGGDPTFVVADYSVDPAGVVVNLQTQRATDGWGGADFFVGIRSARGSEFNDRLTGAANANFQIFLGSGGSDLVAGGGVGRTRVDYLNTANPGAFAVALTLSGPGAGTVEKGASGRDTLTNITDVWGTAGDDSFAVGAGAAVGAVPFRAVGFQGQDTFDGGGNANFAVDYSNDPAPAIVDLGAGTAMDGWGFADTLIDVRRVRLGGQDDSVTGSDGDDVFDYGSVAGAKSINGGGGTDRISYNGDGRIEADLAAGTLLKFFAATGGALIGTDFLRGVEDLFGGDGNDTIAGDGGANVFSGGRGSDTIDGRGGADTVVYDALTAGAPAITRGVLVNLASRVGTDAWGNTDALINIESAVGTAFADRITGAPVAAPDFGHLVGAGGNDVIAMAAPHIRVFASYITSPSGVSVNLLLRTAADGFGGTDQLVNIVSAYGSEFADILTGNAGANILVGSGGDDTLYAVAGAGVDTLDGGAGSDELWGSAAADALIGGEGNDILRGQGGADAMAGGAGDDVYTVFDGEVALLENAGEGTDTAYYVADGLAYAFSDNIEVGRLSASDATLFGTAAGDTLVAYGQRGIALGEGGDDELWAGGTGVTLFGGEGDDILRGFGFGTAMHGGAGTDQYQLGAGDETIVFAEPGWGHDYVFGFVSGVDKILILADDYGYGYEDLVIIPQDPADPGFVNAWAVIAPDGSRVDLIGVFDGGGFFAPLQRDDIVFSST